jgi:4-amino-4-deoxy-L-arabinose transferase-like glycosyltransferase
MEATDRNATAGRPWWRRPGVPERLLAALALAVFLGFLGGPDLWGKREQRSAAETIDTIAANHWLVAEIQCRPRLEKPPLPRWTIASLMLLTGRQDEGIVRLPGALAAIGMVGLTYLLGRRLAGRDAGLAAGLALCSSLFFVIELRQAGNDGPMAFFATLAVYAAWRRLHGGPADGPPGVPAETPGDRRWLDLMYAAFGLGFLCKGPIVVLVWALAIGPYLALAGRLRPGLKALWSPRGLALFGLLALSWPVPVVLADPNAVKVWLLEMGQKAGGAGVQHHQKREILAAEWFWMTAPWSAIATWAALWPPARRGRGVEPTRWLPWSWAVLNLAMFCLWTVAKPNYFLPCLPGVALLVGMEWGRLVSRARGADRVAARARAFLQAHWVALFVAAMVAPVVVAKFQPAYLVAASAGAGAVAVGAVASAWTWRRGGDAAALMPLVAGMAACILVAYGAVAPRENPARSHRALAATLDRVLPPDARTVMFFHELDEGLWFYLRDRHLEPVPRSTPRYNDGYDMLQEYRNGAKTLDLATWAAMRQDRQKQILVDWLADRDRPSPYVLIRAKYYDLFAPALAGRAEVVYRERDVKRNDLVLLKAVDPPAVAADVEPAPEPVPITAGALVPGTARR